MAWAAPETIVPGGDWYDTSGNHVNATEGGIMKVGSLYYLWGMDRSQNNATFIGVNLYSSPDLKNWTFVNTILSSASNTLLGGGATIERAKILYNASTNQYVMWMHYEDHNAYNVAEVAYATCSTISGNYTFQNHFQPMGIDSRDMDVYQDTDGTAYLLCSTNGNQDITIFQLDPTYTSVVSKVFAGAASNGFSCEGHAMIKTGGYYFWITSICSGWAFNDNHYYYATSLAGPWTAGGDIAPTGDETYESQVCWAMPVTGSSQTSFIYMGDRWSVNNFSMSRMVMLPIQVTGTSLKVPWYDQWDIDAAAATWQADPQVVWNENYYIVNRNSGKVLDVYNFSSAAGAIVDQYTNNGGTNQQWTIKNIGGSDYQITNVNSGLLLEINGAATVAGSFADQYTSNGGFNQKWHIIDSSQGAGYYRLINVGTLEKDLEVPGGSTSNGVTTELGNFNYSTYQEWEFVSVNATLTPTPMAGSPTATATPTRTATASPTVTPTASSTTTRSMTPTASSTASATASRTLTATPSNTSSWTSTASLTPTASRTATPSSTATASPTGTPTPTASSSPTKTFSPTASPSPTSTQTSSPTSTYSMTPTVSYTVTITPSATATVSPMATATSSFTATLTATTAPPTKTPSPMATSTPASTFTSSLTPTDSTTLTVTPTITVTFSPTASRTASVSSTATSSMTATASLTVTPTVTAAFTASPTATGTPTETDSMTLTSSPTGTDTATFTPALSATNTGTATASSSPTKTPSFTASFTPIFTVTFSLTPTDSMTLTATPTITVTPSLTASWTASSTSSPSPSRTFTATETPSWTATPTSTPTSTKAISFTPTATATVQAPNGIVLYPNPVTGSGPVTLQIRLSAPANGIQISLYTTAFRKVNEIVLGNLSAGTSDISLNLTDRSGAPLANGLYYVVVQINGQRSIAKLLVAR